MKYILLLLVSIPLFAQKEMTPQMSEAWEPVPEIINPGDANSPPSDAIVLFDGTDLSQWINAKTGKVADWTINPDGSMTVKQDGGIETKEEFGSIQLHIEWRTPPVIKGKGQGRGNSGVSSKKPMKFRFWTATTMSPIPTDRQPLFTNNRSLWSMLQDLLESGKPMILFLMNRYFTTMGTVSKREH